MLPGPIVLLSPYCPLSFPGAQKSSWEEKDATSVFLAYNWLIIFGSAAAGPLFPPGGGTDSVSAAPLALFVRQQSNTVDRGRLGGAGRGLWFLFRHTWRKLSHAALKAGSLIVTRLPPGILALYFLPRRGLIQWYPIMHYADQTDWLHHFVTILITINQVWASYGSGAIRNPVSFLTRPAELEKLC